MKGGSEPALVGELLAGRYRLQRLLGRGGYGEVMEALDSLTDTRVAVKILTRTDERHAARVRREVSVMRLLRIPGVARLIDEGVENERVFIVMDLVPGSAFPGQKLPAPWEDVNDLVFRLLETLGRMHGLGVVHRDLKPGNIMVGENGEVTLLDFGLSAVEATPGDALTIERELLGTPAYLAPEQIRGEEISPATDLYSLGVLMFEILVGRPPHQGTTLPTLMRNRLTHVPPRLRTLVPDVPVEVDVAVASMLSLTADARPKSAAEVLRLLRGGAPATHEFPRVGGLSEVATAVRFLVDGQAVVVRGAPKSGRSRLLRDVASELEACGIEPHVVSAREGPFESLVSVAASTLGRDLSLDQMRSELAERVRSIAADGGALLIDDEPRLDPFSREIVARHARGRVLVITDSGERWAAQPDAHTLDLQPLALETLSALFLGPERLLHLKSDAARVLAARTGGAAGRVANEISSWLRAGLCRWEAGLISIARAALQRLEAEDVRQFHDLVGSLRTESLPESSREAIGWLTLHARPLPVALLSSLVKTSRWSLEATLESLHVLGIVETRAGLVALVVPINLDEIWPPGRIQAARQVLAQALAAGAAGRLGHLVASRPDSDDERSVVAREAITVAERLAREGYLGQAELVLGEGLRAVRGRDSLAKEAGDLLALFARVAFTDGTALAFDRALYELHRTSAEPSFKHNLDLLLQTAHTALVFSERGAQLAEQIAPFEQAALDRWRRFYRFHAIRRSSSNAEEHEVEAIDAWAKAVDHPEARAVAETLRGRHLYVRHRFEEAASLHESVASLEAWQSLATLSRMYAASAWLECGRYDLARERALEVKAWAMQTRSSAFEARAERVLRSVAYRTLAIDDVDRELVAAIKLVGAPDTEAMVLLTEAAVAWRLGLLDEARALAVSVRDAWAARAYKAGSLLSHALAVASGEPATEAQLDEELLHASALDPPLIGVQAYALLLSVRFPHGHTDTTLERLVSALPAEQSDLIGEVLSANEALALAAGTWSRARG